VVVKTRGVVASPARRGQRRRGGFEPDGNAWFGGAGNSSVEGGRKVLTAYAPVPQLGWLVFVELPIKAVFAHAMNRASGLVR
jgi:hypothetical protein